MSIEIKRLVGETTEYDKKESLEVKRPKSWLKSVSAFANGIGGTLIFGIANDDTVVGIEDAEHDAETISECIKTKIDPIPDTNLHFYAENGKKLILLDVHAGQETPYYYVGDGNRIAFVRVGNESIPADNVALKRLVLKGTNRSYDSLVSKYKFENMAFTKLRSVYKYNTGKDFEDTDYESWGIIDEDGNLTNAGALLADESPIRHSRVFCTRWNGLDKAPGLMDVIDDEEISGGLVTLLQESVNFVSRNTKKAWRKTGTGRIEMPDYPDRAVLEGIVNALIHRSYLDPAKVQVAIYDDRLEVTLPGMLIGGVILQELKDGCSKPRNRGIVNAFTYMKNMDEWGSGIPRLFDDCAKTGLKEPELMEIGGSFRVNVYRKTELILDRSQDNTASLDAIQDTDQASLDTIRIENVAAKPSNVELTSVDRQLLELLQANKEITQIDMADYLDWKIGKVKYYIDKLKRKGVIERVGTSQKGYWKVLI